MAIFDEPSRGPLPQPRFEDVENAARKGLVSMVPFIGGVASELLGLLASPVARRRDDWLADLERRLRELEDQVADFRFDDLAQNEQFVSATLVATQNALRTHQPEKLEALRNVVLNVAVGRTPPGDLQLIFLNFVDSFTPTHLHVLMRFYGTSKWTVASFNKDERDLTDQAVRDLHDRGLIRDTRPYAAQNRDSAEPLVYYDWEVTNLGKQFLEFVKSPEPVKS